MFKEMVDKDEDKMLVNDSRAGVVVDVHTYLLRIYLEKKNIIMLQKLSLMLKGYINTKNLRVFDPVLFI
jgi:hypothetical protein